MIEPTELQTRVFKQLKQEDKEWAIYTDNMEKVSKLLNEQLKRKPTEAVAKLLGWFCEIHIYTERLRSNAFTYQYNINKLEKDLLKARALKEKAEESQSKLQEEIDILTKDIHALEQRI